MRALVSHRRCRNYQIFAVEDLKYPPSQDFHSQPAPLWPDLLGTVGKVFGGNFTLKMVEEPKATKGVPAQVSQIESMTGEESMERFHWFFCVYVLIFLGVTLLGSGIMVLGFGRVL